MRWRAAIGGVLLGVVSVFAVASASPAMAHGMLDGTSPADGSVVETMPPSVVLLFNEPVTLPPEPVRILDQSGNPVSVTDVSVSPSGSGSNVNATLEPAEYAGWYGVTWTVISSDGHQIQGTFTFVVGTEAVTGPVPELEIDDPTEWFRKAADPLRGLSYLVTLLAIGSLTALWSIKGSSPESDRMRRRLRRWTLISALAGLIVVPATLVLNAIILNGGSTENLSITTRIVLQSSTGISMLLRASALFGVCAAIPLLVEKSTRIVGWVVGAAAGVALTVSYAMAGHTTIVDLRWLSAVALVVHLVAAGMWIGALPGLGYVALGRPPLPLSDAAATLTRFSYVATVSLIAVFVAGTLLTFTMLNQIQDMWTTSYGITLAVKICIVGLAALFGAVNHFLVVPLIQERAKQAAGSGKSGGSEGAVTSRNDDVEQDSQEPGAQDSQEPGAQETSKDHQRHARTAIRVEALFIVALVVATAWLTTSGAPKAGGSHAVHQGFGHGHGSGLGVSLSEVLRDNEPKTVLTNFGDGEIQVDYYPGIAGQTNTITFTPTNAKGKKANLDELAVEISAPSSTGMGSVTRTGEDNGDGTWSLATSDLGFAGFWTLNISGKRGLAVDEATVEIEVREPSGGTP